MGETDNQFVTEDVVLQPPNHPWWHWALLIATVVIEIISFVILVHVGLFAGMLLQAAKHDKKSAGSMDEMAQVVEAKESTLRKPDFLPSPLPDSPSGEPENKSPIELAPSSSEPPPRPSSGQHAGSSERSRIKVSRETKKIENAPKDEGKAVPLPPQGLKPPNLNNIPGIARYQYIKPAMPKQGNHQAAIGHFEKAVRSHRLNQLQAAIIDYQKALAADPGMQEAHHNLALALQAKGQLKEALAEFEVALAINPLSRESRQGFATALNSSNYYIDAAREYQVLLQTFPNHGPAHLDLAGVYANHLKMSAEAKAHYRRALELAPNHQQAPAIRAWLSNNP